MCVQDKVQLTSKILTTEINCNSTFWWYLFSFGEGFIVQLFQTSMTSKITIEHVEVIVYLVLSLWLFVLVLFQRMLQASTKYDWNAQWSWSFSRMKLMTKGVWLLCLCFTVDPPWRHLNIIFRYLVSWNLKLRQVEPLSRCGNTP